MFCAAVPGQTGAMALPGSAATTWAHSLARQNGELEASWLAGGQQPGDGGAH